ncbi:MAG TPA: ADOP family duplicated permease [Longimicrobium sp.]|nr:ADOP family duplicated permease [Longimicrobium sp.]
MVRLLADTGRDIASAARLSARRPALALAALLTIALGLGATAAILGVVRAALWEPLPYRDADRLVQVGQAPLGSARPDRTSLPTLLDWREGNRAFSGLEAYEGTNVTARVGDDSEMIRGWRVTPGFFGLLGVSPSAGRTWADGDDGVAGEVVVSARLAGRMGGAERALGAPLVIDGSPRTIVGVMSPAFHFGDDADVWLPLTPNANQRVNRANRWLGVVGRLREGVDRSAAHLDLQRITSSIAAEHPADMEGQTVAVSPLRDVFLGNVKPILVSLLAAVAVLLLITAANLGAVMLLRNLDRRDELAVRAALGASRGRLARQLFVEGLLLALVGAFLSLYVGRIGIELMSGAIPERLRAGMPYLADARIDASIVALVVGVAVVMAVAFALWPAWRAASAVAPGRHGTRLTMGRADRRIRRMLVMAQLGLTVVLLIGTAQLATSFRNLVGQEIGVRAPDEILTLNIAVAGPAYADDAAVQTFYEELVRRVEALPQVAAAGAVNELPLSGSGMTTAERVENPLPQGQRPQVALRILAGDYFTAMGVRLREGRLLGPRDDTDAPAAMVVSASFAERMGFDGPVLGRRIRLTRTGDTQWEIVGVVDDVHMSKLDAEPPPSVYVGHLQLAENRLPLVVRTTHPAAAVAASVRDVVRALDPAIPVYSVATLGEQMRQSGAVFSRRFPLVIGAVFAGAALLLAMLGLYSLCAHEVLSRRREITVRQALGATPAGVRRVLLRDGLRLALPGVFVGVLIAMPASRIVRSLLFGVGPVEPVVYGGVAAGVLFLAILATAVPAWRGSNTELATALRSG